MRVARFARLMSCAIRPRSALVVDQRSSHSRIGRPRPPFAAVRFARVGAARLRARAFAAVHVERQADHQSAYAALGDQRRQRRLVRAELAAAQRLRGAGEAPAGVAEREADRLRAEIERHQCAAARQRLAERRRGSGNGGQRRGAFVAVSGHAGPAWAPPVWNARAHQCRPNRRQTSASNSTSSSGGPSVATAVRAVASVQVSER